MTSAVQAAIRPIAWVDGRVRLIDQTLLPHREVWLELSDYREVVAAIKEMRIRGAPAIGVAGAYAVAIAAAELMVTHPGDFANQLEKAASEIGDARPTGANLAWAVDRMLHTARTSESPATVVEALATEAMAIQDEDEDANRAMGRHGAQLLPQGGAILTHCNAGSLATGGFGTALGIIMTAWEDGRISKVIATETRPFLQGARLTAWELTKGGVDASLIADSAAGHMMQTGAVQAVVTGADRIAANGDVANKIGTYSLAVLAKENGIPFYVAAPTSTLDLDLPSGRDIVIEYRSPDELTELNGERVAADGIDAINPAFDVTPHRYVTAIVTEKGVVRKPYGSGLRNTVEGTVG
ncbi:MAG: S-methyl-5-thioribose-1-phosphate isomerase [Chloroflexi bacterium]|nr:S-methyl-5-thioribose-1-phosphate isomerase [Chloroflexota bacterium]